MTIRKINSNEEKLNYEELILEYLRENPSGSTLTDIITALKISRGTGSKYVSVLEAKEKVINKRIGAYNFYFASAPSYVPVRTIVLFYEGLLKELNKNSNNKEEKYFKELGYKISENFNALFSSNLTIPEDTSNYSVLLKVLARLYPSIDVMQYRGIKISADINNTGTKADYHLQNIKLFDESNDFLFHFYIISGILEKQLKRLLHKEVKTNIDNYNFEKKTLTLSIDIG